MKAKILGLVAASLLVTPAITMASQVTYQFNGQMSGYTGDPRPPNMAPPATFFISQTWEFPDFVENLMGSDTLNPYKTSCTSMGAYLCRAEFYLNYLVPDYWPDGLKSGVVLTFEYYTASDWLLWGMSEGDGYPFPCPADSFSTVGTFQCLGGTLTVSRVGGPEVPEPGTLALLGLGLAGLGLSRRRKAH